MLITHEFSPKLFQLYFIRVFKFIWTHFKWFHIEKNFLFFEYWNFTCAINERLL